MFFLLHLILLAPQCDSYAAALAITARFRNGDLDFVWTNTSQNNYEIFLSKDGRSDPWVRVFRTQYSLADIMMYNSVRITVFDQKTRSSYQHTYEVLKFETEDGKSTNVTLPTECTENATFIFIIKWRNDNNTDVKKILLKENSHVIEKTSKYAVYYGLPVSGETALEIRGVTLSNAAYYSCGNRTDDALSRQGVILVVHQKPIQPTLRTDRHTKGDGVVVGTSINLTCSSNSTSSPHYYSKVASLSYAWFVGDETLRETDSTLTIKVTRSFRNKTIMCTAKNFLESIHSEALRIIPLYGPETIEIIPQPPIQRENKVIITEGMVIGPYDCAADCNPPCDVTWSHANSTGSSYALVHGEQTLQHIVSREMVSFSCRAEGKFGQPIERTILLDVIYMDLPLVYINEEQRIQADVREGTTLHVSCFVNGNPTPRVRLSKVKDSGSAILSEVTGPWSNYSSDRGTQCSDTGAFDCVGMAAGLGTESVKFDINVLCEARRDIHEMLNIYNGTVIGFEDTVIVKIPVIANPSPVAKKVSWLDFDNQAINVKTVVLQPGNVSYRHLIISIVPWNGVEQNRTYSVNYGGRLLTKITIDSKDLQKPASERFQNRESRFFLISVCLSVVLGVSLLGVTVVLCRMKGRQTDPSNQDIVQVEDQGTINFYEQATSSDNNHLYSTLDTVEKETPH